MKQVAQNYRSGELTVLDVPAPAVPAGRRARCGSVYSLISTGTEMMKVSEARLSLLGKARARPDQVRKVVDSVAQQGPVGDVPEGDEPARQLHPARLLPVRRRRRGRRGSEEFAVGRPRRGRRQRVRPPRRGQLGTDQPVRPGAGRRRPPSTQRSRRWAPSPCRAYAGPRSQLGESACVIGLGLVGQLVVRLLVAAGVRVVGLDTVGGALPRWPRRPARCSARRPTPLALAHRRAGRCTASPGASGADHVFLAAGGGYQRARSSWPRGWRATGPASSTSARPGSTCRGTPTTRRSSTSASPVPTDPGATTTATSWTGSTTRPATCAGPSAATSIASSTCSPTAASPSASAGVGRPSRSPTQPRSTSSCAPERCRASASCSSTRRRRRRSPRPTQPPGARPEATTSGSAGARGAAAGGHGARRLRRRRQLRHLDAAAPPRPRTRRRRCAAGRDHRRCRRSTRSASSASSDAHHGRRDVLDDPIDRRRVRRDPPPLPCGASCCRALESGKAVFVEKPLALASEQLERGRRDSRSAPATTA